MHLDEGTYDIQITYHGPGGKRIYTDYISGVRIEAGHLNVIESAYLN